MPSLIRVFTRRTEYLDSIRERAESTIQSSGLGRINRLQTAETTAHLTKKPIKEQQI